VARFRVQTAPDFSFKWRVSSASLALYAGRALEAFGVQGEKIFEYF
jgi:hypothetical protein